MFTEIFLPDHIKHLIGAAKNDLFMPRVLESQHKRKNIKMF